MPDYFTLRGPHRETVCGPCALDAFIGTDDHYYNLLDPMAVFDRVVEGRERLPVPHYFDEDEPVLDCEHCGESLYEWNDRKLRSYR